MYFAFIDDDINNKYHFYKQGLNKVLHKKEINEKINDVNKMPLDRCIYFVHGVDEICESYDGCSNFIRILIIPHNANIREQKYGSLRFDKVILSEKYPLFDIKTIKKFNLIIDREYIIQVCLNKSLDILKYLYYNDNEFINIVKKDSDIFDSIAMRDNVEILEWWKTIGLPTNINNYIASIASCYGNVNVLEWWFNSGLGLKYDKWGMNNASMHGHVNVLNWWVNSGLPLLYDEHSIDRGSSGGHVNVLNWWVNSGLPLKYTEKAIDDASMYGKLDVLEWWKNSGLPLKYSENAIDRASSHGHVDVLKWWKNSGLPLKYTEGSIDYACETGCNYECLNDKIINILNWWFKSGLELKYSKKALQYASKGKNINILEWLKNSKLPF
jgi:hypothetical protein